MSTLVARTARNLCHQCFSQACITPAVFGYAMGHHQMPWRLFAVPAVYEGRGIGAAEPERLADTANPLSPQKLGIVHPVRRDAKSVRV